MNMKRTLALVLTIAICATMALGGTLAYLTDTEEAVNVMTVGRVDIELIEQQRSEDGGLEPFEDNKQLLPAVGSAQGTKDDWGMPVMENYMDKIVNVANIGNTDAYVRVIVGIPAALEAPQASQNVLHWNYGNRFDPEGDGEYNEGATNRNPQYANIEMEELGKVAKIDGVEYNVYVFTYEDILGEKASTYCPAIVGCYLDENLDWNDEAEGPYQYHINGTTVEYDFSKGVKIPVVAQAVQADGFANADEAFTASGLPNNPWENVTTDVTVVADAESLEAALEAGGTVALDERITLTTDTTTISKPTTLSLGEHAVISSRTASSAAGSSTLNVQDDTVIEGNGTIENEKEYVITMGTKDATVNPTLTIKGGNYIGKITAVNVVSGTLNIEGGYFEVGESNYGSTYLINCNDANYRDGKAMVIITGGTFKGWNPADNASENPRADFVPDGYEVIYDTENDTYTVVPVSEIE